MRKSRAKSGINAAPTRNEPRYLEVAELRPGLWLRHNNYVGGVSYYQIECVNRYHVKYKAPIGFGDPDPIACTASVADFLRRQLEIVDDPTPEKEEAFRQEDFQWLVVDHKIACEKVREIEAQLRRERITFELFTAA